MRQFIYYSSKARTTGNFDKSNLMKAGRMDIACQIVIMTFFVSHHTRENVKLHLVFNGPPDAPKHLELFPGDNFLGDDEKRIDISKKDVAGLIKRMLYKYKKGEKREVSPGYFIEKKSLVKIVEEFLEEGKKVYILDRRGDDIRKIEDKDLKDAVFVVGDQEGIPKPELKKLKKLGIDKINIGKQMYFASQTVTIVNNELDRREL
jgi:tRNA pseudouridine-54 N-methylase